MRQTLDDAGAVLGSVQYDPWGVPTTGTPQPFGFTGELHSAGQVYLRARWYAPGQGRFVSEDPFAGFPELPYSLHAYQYAYSNPVRWTDPSGHIPGPPVPPSSPLTPPIQYDLIRETREVYSKNGSSRNCALTPDDGQSDLTDTVDDLFTDYICEYGSKDREYRFNARLTQELARTRAIALLRQQFYMTGGIRGGPSQMGPGAFWNAKVRDSLSECTRTVFGGISVCASITDFLGGFDSWSVSRSTFHGKDTVSFEIRNTTSLVSGSRIGVSRMGVRDISLEEYAQDPRAFNRNMEKRRDLSHFDFSRYNLISILPERTIRDSTTTTGPGGGTMTRRVTWEEPYLPCGEFDAMVRPIPSPGAFFPADGLLEGGGTW